MRTLSSALNAGAATLTWSTCTRVTRRDGTIERYTDHDRNITVGAETFLARQGYTHTSLRASTRMDPNSVDLAGPIYIDGVDVDDLRQGAYDSAFVELFLVNWQNANLAETLIAGWLGDIRYDGEQYETEIRGLAQKLNDTTIVEVYTPDCRADLGDSRCKVSLAAFTVAGTVSSVTTARRAFVASSVPTAAGGELTWTSGANSGLTVEVKAISGSTITLFVPTPKTITAGDGYSVYAGCDKSLTTCNATFGNVVNFRGEPWAPGSDWQFFSPDFFNFLA